MNIAQTSALVAVSVDLATKEIDRLISENEKLKAEVLLEKEKMNFVVLVVDRCLMQWGGTSVAQIVRLAHVNLNGVEKVRDG